MGCYAAAGVCRVTGWAPWRGVALAWRALAVPPGSMVRAAAVDSGNSGAGPCGAVRDRCVDCVDPCAAAARPAIGFGQEGEKAGCHPLGQSHGH